MTILNYRRALAMTGAAAVIAVASDALFEVPFLVAFPASVSMNWTMFGRGPALVSLLAGILLTDLFFIQPLYGLSLNLSTLRLAAIYFAGVLMAVVMTRAVLRAKTARDARLARPRSL